jgi:hypothetical protein
MKKQIFYILSVTTLLLTACEGEIIEPADRAFKTAPEPVITSFYPESIVGGSPMVIFGENFGTSLTDNYVTLNGESAEVTHVQHGGVVVRIPLHLPPGDYIIRLTARGKTAKASSSCTLVTSE